METAYYKSPLGEVKIMGDGYFIQQLCFTKENIIDNNPGNEPLSSLMQQCVEQLNEFFRGERQNFTIPLKQPGTDFQQRVWKELLNIPYGKTVSYLELSRRLGDTKAIRAVAAGNGKNKISILVPCHRVVGSDNSLVGYAWGNQRKQWLLQHEARWANGVQTLF